jgi:DNA replication protein DnaC
MYKEAHYINPYFLYYKTYKSYPSKESYTDVDYIAVFKKIIETYEVPNNKVILSTFFLRRKKETKADNFYIDLGNGICVFQERNPYNGESIEILFSYKDINEKKHEIEKLRNLIFSFFKKNEYSRKINLLCGNVDGFHVQNFYINENEINLERNYNDDIIPVAEKIQKRLKTKKDKGIIFLYGKPGTGKSHFLRYLINSIEKEVIYITPDVAQHLGSPNFLSFLVEHPESVLIIEDSENVIQERSHVRSNVVSNLLNMSDGLLSDCLNIQIICTFNLDIKNVDKAFLRKGRLIAQYEFKELEKEKAQKLIDHLGFKHTATQAMTLAEIYNLNEKELDNKINEVKPIGFK